MTLKEKIVANGVNNLRAYGYPKCDASNILTDDIYREFFASMLRDNKGHSPITDKAIDELLTEISS